jgi:hypothetical protein
MKPDKINACGQIPPLDLYHMTINVVNDSDNPAISIDQINPLDLGGIIKW